MISKNIERQRACELRKRGFSYNDILKELKVSKSTLSLWLRDIGLANRHKRILSERQRISRENGIKIWHQMRVDKTIRIKDLAAREIKYVSDRELWFIGIALYWAEGTKEKEKGTRIIFSNSDPLMIILFRKWLFKFMNVKPEELTFSLYIHEKSANHASARRFWADLLLIEEEKITFVFKRHNSSPKRKNIGVNYRGLIRIVVKRSIDMNRRISGWIDGINNNIGD